MREALLAEFDHEMATTRRMLERVPEAHLSWKPHPKSMSLQVLVSHLVNIPTWLPPTLEQSFIDMAPVGEAPITTPQQTSRDQWMQTFDTNVANARASLAALEAPKLAELWSLKAGEKIFFTLPKGAVLRSFIFNHLIHHRAQLGVYLRLLDVPLPSVYGPTADEAM
ncbi:MAG: DUF664 domain-containing protein [Firmicutes bacterium]|nr:DUF664 domain-containing protein [Bacillota bacterium]